MTAREGPSVRPASRARGRWRATGAPPSAPPDRGVVPAKLRPPQARVRLVERRALLDALGQDGRAAGRAVRAGRRRQDHGAPAVDRGRPRARSPGCSSTRADNDPVVLLTYCRSRARGRHGDGRRRGRSAAPRGASRARARAAAARRRLSPARRPSSWSSTTRTCSRATSRGMSSRSSCAACRRARSWRSDPAPTLSFRSRGCGRRASWPSSGRRRCSSTVAEILELMSLHDCETDDVTVDAILDATEGWATGLQLACLAPCGTATGRVAARCARQPPRVRGVPHVGGPGRAAGRDPGVPAPHVRPPRADARPLFCWSPAATTGVSCSPASPERSSSSSRSTTTAPTTATTTSLRRCSRESWSGGIPAWPAELHRAVAAWCEREGAPDAAVQHLLAAGDTAAAGDVVAAAWPRMWSRGQVETVRRWLDAFDDRQIISQPALTLTAGWVYTALDAGRPGRRWAEAACGLAHGRLPVAGRRRVAAVLAGAAAGDHRRRRRPAHARGRGAGRQARMPRRAPAGTRTRRCRSASRAGSRDRRGARSIRWPSGRARARSATRPRSSRRWAIWR